MLMFNNVYVTFAIEKLMYISVAIYVGNKNFEHVG